MPAFLGYVLLVLVPALGVWLASSLTAWFGGSPRRSQVTVSGSHEVLLKNPRRRYLLAHRLRSEGGDQADCDVSSGPSATVRCGFASPGTYRVRLFSPGRPDEAHWMVGEIEVQNR